MNRTVVHLGQQLLGIWKQLGLNQRISVALAAIVVAVALSSLAFWSSRVDYALLYGKLDDAEAAKVVAHLDDSKVPHKIGQGGGAIYVPRDKVHLLRMQLAARGIPRGDGVGFEIFDKPNFGISDFVQRANYLRALQGELARTIGQLDEVEAARVMIVLPENRLLVDNQKKPTASVFVRTKGHAVLPPSAVNSIRFLVANAVEGLQAGHVTIVDNRGNVLSENAENDSIVGLTASQLTARRNLEQYLAQKAEGMLEAVLGPGQAVVRVSAEVNLDSSTRTEEKFDPESQVVRISTVNDESTDTTSANAGGGGAPGVAANSGADTNSAAGSPASSSKNKKKVINSQYEINKITSNSTQIAGGIKRVSAAVFVAARYEGTNTDRKIMVRTPEELTKLRRIVQNAIGIQSTGDGKDEITLEEMPFTDSIGEVSKDLGQQEKKQFWWTQLQNIIYPTLALGVLIIFWRALKKTPVGEIPADMSMEDTSPAPNAHSRAGGQANGRGRAQKPAVAQGLVTADVFNQLVRDNPANVTHAIQNWLTRGAPPNN